MRQSCPLWRAESSSKGEPGRRVGNILDSTGKGTSRRPGRLTRLWTLPAGQQGAPESFAPGVPRVLALFDSTLPNEPTGGAGQAEGARQEAVTAFQEGDGLGLCSSQGALTRG